MPAITNPTTAYYQAAVLGLRALDAREGRGRRFGPEADARWGRLKGRLHDGDRLQVLLRDASAPWGIAFAASHIVQLDGVARDEPFGPGWVVPNGTQARRYLDIDDAPTLDRCAALLGVTPAAVELPELRPTTHLLVAGGPPSSLSRGPSPAGTTSTGPARSPSSPTPPHTASSRASPACSSAL